jgi:hypothetical protein
MTVAELLQISAGGGGGDVTKKPVFWANAAVLRPVTARKSRRDVLITFRC